MSALTGPKQYPAAAAAFRKPEVFAEPERWEFDPDAWVQPPKVELGFGVTAQVCLISPETAAELLGNLFVRQRNVKTNHLASVREDLEAGRFKFNGEPIILNRRGAVMDGQHRLLAVVETGVPIVALVLRGFPDEVYPTLDITSKRTGADAVRSAGFDYATIIASAVLLLKRHERGLFERGTYIVLSPIAIEDALTDYPGIVESAAVASRLKKTVRVCGACCFAHYHLAGLDRERADWFFERLHTGAGLEQGNPILSLREKFRSERAEEPTAFLTVCFLFKAWNAWRKGRPLSSFRMGPEEPMPKPV
jgi:hypothetical protein